MLFPFKIIYLKNNLYIKKSSLEDTISKIHFFKNLHKIVSWRAISKRKKWEEIISWIDDFLKKKKSWEKSSFEETIFSQKKNLINDIFLNNIIIINVYVYKTN